MAYETHWVALNPWNRCYCIRWKRHKMSLVREVGSSQGCYTTCILYISGVGLDFHFMVVKYLG